MWNAHQKEYWIILMRHKSYRAAKSKTSNNRFFADFLVGGADLARVAPVRRG